VVRIGAIALQLTGLEWSLAKFQALSCFTGTGFTTKESELITSNIRRRRIASILMVLGNAGLVSMIATFANSLRPSDIPDFTLPFLKLNVSNKVMPWVNLVIIGISFYVVYRMFIRSKFAIKFTQSLRSKIIKRTLVKKVTFEELLVATGGYGISNIEICENSPVLDKTILESGLRKLDITILVVERGREVIPNPSPSTNILLGDKLICFGKLDNIRKKLSAVAN